MGRKLFDGKNYESVIQKLEHAWGCGCSDNEAAAYADIASSALCAFLKKNPKIAERKEALKELPFFAARNAIKNAMEEGDADIALKFMERKKNKEFSVKQEVEHAGAINISLGKAEKDF